MAEVQLYIYDLSAGLAQQFSTMMLGKQIEGIWHTSVVVFEKEHYFGMEGVSVCEPGSTNLGSPLKIETVGTTYVTDSLFQEYLEGLKENEFAPGTYNLIEHNCNTFSNELCQFLVGKNIPEYILSLPKDVIHCIVSNPIAAAFIQTLITANRHPSSDDFEALNNDIDDARQQK